MSQIKYPRNRIVRGAFRVLGRALINLLTQPEIKGYENYPRKGNLIVVANHSGLMETVLMTSFSPRQIEYMGSVDIPHEKLLALFMNAYQFIPVYRGNVSVSAMKDGISVLKQGGVIGIFPEGGIWEPQIRKAHAGVAWMSYHGNSPILPIGFTPTTGALHQALSLKRPKIKMRIGEVLPPVSLIDRKPKKDQFQNAAQKIMDTVWQLVPNEDLHDSGKILDETFQFQVSAFSKSKTRVEIPKDLDLTHGSALSKILYRTTLINNLRDNLKLNISPLKNLDKSPSAEAIISSTAAILAYLKDDNPYYFTYRYGQQEGSQMMQSLQEFHNFAVWAEQNNYQIQATPIRSYRLAGNEKEIVETHPTEQAKW